MVMVILVHSRTRYPGLSSTFDIFKFGQMGCQLFFVLSGYSLCLSWSKDSNAKRFYAKRYISIAPGYYLMIVIMTLLTFLSESAVHRKIGFGGNTDPFAILSNFLLLNGLLPEGNNDVVGGGWYIGTTVVLYVLFPLLYIIFKRSTKKAVIPISIMIFQFVIVTTLYYFTNDAAVLENNSFIYFNFVNETACFALGMLLWFQINDENKKTDVITDIVLFLIFAVVSIGLFYGDFEFAFVLITDTFGLAAFFITRAFINIEKLTENKQENKIKKWLSQWGRRSYYIYLSHTFFAFSMSIIIAELWERLGKPVNINIVYLLVLPFIFLGSWLLSVILEKIISPISKKGYQLIYKKQE